MDSIQSVSPVVELEYKSKDEILNDIKAKEPDLVKMLERNNPLPNTIVISNIPLEVYEKINPFIENK
jgi:cell division protein FtsX|tara:strand:+ start:43 stop:243 length:201 start_codon:yes stop_codon:yes gene_type:complete